MRILVTGSDGLLGRAVMARLGTQHDLAGVDLAQGDLTRSQDVGRIFADTQPDWVVHCAAFTDVDGAETQRDLAMAVNGDATALVAEACGRCGAGLSYISTDYVFNGRGPATGYTEADPRDPVNHYGLTKARGEEAVEALESPWQIVRTSWLFGDGPVNFPRTIVRLLGERDKLQVVDDQRGCPTYAPDLAEILAFLVSRGSRGIFHGTNAGPCTWFDVAREVARCTGADPDRIAPCPSSAYPTPAVRPANSVLASRRLEEAGCPDRPSWQAALGRYLESLTS